MLEIFLYYHFKSLHIYFFNSLVYFIFSCGNIKKEYTTTWGRGIQQ